MPPSEGLVSENAFQHRPIDKESIRGMSKEQNNAQTPRVERECEACRKKNPCIIDFRILY
jgi:hypothetical protein